MKLATALDVKNDALLNAIGEYAECTGTFKPSVILDMIRTEAEGIVIWGPFENYDRQEIVRLIEDTAMIEELRAFDNLRKLGLDPDSPIFADIFDDLTEDEHGLWTQICPKCAKKMGLELAPAYETENDNFICGVRGCENAATHYLSLVAIDTATGYHEIKVPIKATITIQQATDHE